MRSSWKILFGIFAMGAFFLNTLYSAEDAVKTEKIKILSAYCLNNKWSFRVYDGVTGKSLSLKLGRKNALGYKVESFDESKQTAIIATPRGRFTVVMQVAKVVEPIVVPPKPVEDSIQADKSDDKKPPKRKRILRSSVLKRMK